MRALLVLVFATSAAAQSWIDPYEYSDKTDLHTSEIKLLWRRLGIGEKIRETTARGAKDTDKIFDCGEDDRCTAKMFSSPWTLLDDGTYDVVLRVSPSYLNANMRRFIVLHYLEGLGAWTLVDYLDSTEWDYDEPEVSTISSGGTRWLVLKAWPHCGTGCSLIHTDWFELKNGKLRMVLTLPISGDQVNENPARQFETRFVRANQSEGRETLEFIYHGEFAPGFGSTVDANLWDDEEVVRFSRPIGQVEFKFDSKNSKASLAFVENIFSSDELGPSRLLGLVQNHLVEIAQMPNDRRRGWLKEVLEQNPTLPELAQVCAAFAKAP